MARRAQSLSQASQLRQNAAQTRQAIAVLLGQTAPDPAWDAPATPLTLAPFRFAQLPADMVRSRPEIRTAEAEVARAAAELGMARADLYPRISLGASYLYAYNLTQNRRSTVDRLPVVGPSIDIPLFDWGRRRTTVDVKQDMLDTSLIAYRQAVVQGIGEAESALIALAGQEERVALAGNVVDALAQREAILRKRTSLKLATEFDAAASGRAVLQAELERSAAEAARAQAFVALYKSLGGAPMPAGNDQLVGQRSSTITSNSEAAR
jgi:outer membrane protein TolC